VSFFLYFLFLDSLVCCILADRDYSYGIRPTTATNSSGLVDSIVWIKPAGESDGACGPSAFNTSAPAAGQWWDEYAQQSVVYANPPLTPTY
jgi:cellulose 1,4-beta-cellobiosidase